MVTFSYSPYCIEQLEKLKAKSEGKPKSEDATVYKAVRRQIEEVLPEPARCFMTKNLLKGIPNVATEYVGTDRWRLAYIVSQEKNLCVLLGIFYRKGGDKHDAYIDIIRMISMFRTTGSTTVTPTTRSGQTPKPIRRQLDPCALPADWHAHWEHEGHQRIGSNTPQEPRG